LRGRKEGRIGMLRATLALFCVALVVAAVAPSSAEPIREGSYAARRNLILDRQGRQDLELLIEEPEQDADIIGSRAKRSPVFPGYDVFQLKAFKAAKKLKKKKVKKLIKASPFLAAKAVKKKVKLAPPLAALGGFGGALAAAPLVGGAGALGSLGSVFGPALAGLGGLGGAASVPMLVGDIVPSLIPAGSAFSALVGR